MPYAGVFNPLGFSKNKNCSKNPALKGRNSSAQIAACAKTPVAVTHPGNNPQQKRRKVLRL